MSPRQPSRSQPTEALGRLVQLLIDGADSIVLDRIVVETIASLGVARSLALWHEDPEGELRASYSVGDDAALPTRAQVRAHLAGSAPLVDDPFVVAVGEHERWVLALAGIVDPDELSGAQTLLEVCAQAGERSECLDDVPAALPASAEDPGTRRLAHDLRNHLMGLRTTCDVLDVLAEELADEERDHYGEVVQRECRRAGELLASLLDGSHARIASPGAELVDAVRDVVVSERSVCVDTLTQLDSFVEPAVADVTYRLSAVELSRLVRNLVVNAREAGAHRIRVECLRDKSPRDGLVVTVGDDGTGIPPCLKDSLFDPGTSTKSTEPGRGEGSVGNGLAIARELVVGAGGSLNACNPPTGGARFELWIPRATTD